MYQIRIKKSAIKELSTIPNPFHLKIAEAIDALSLYPRPEGVKKLKGEENAWRIRVADYRIIYTIGGFYSNNRNSTYSPSKRCL